MPPALLKTSSALPAPRTRTGGFALLITITLLSFVVLLLVGLATYTRIETAISGNTQKQAQARQNALLALDVALGQLQKHAGPDQRVTATAESVTGVVNQKRYYTGVWDSTDAAAPPVWLVSGLESATSPSVTTAIPAASQVTLVGSNTDGSAFLANGNSGPNQVVVPLQALTSVGVPGQATAATIGRYAWWVGDQGVKAPVALGDTTAAVTYAPYNSDDARSRIRQQISLGAGAADATGAPIFEPRDSANAPIIRNVTATNQLAFLKTSGGSVGAAVLRQNYHAWSANNYNVLASTASNSAGLRRDLSIDPMLLGNTFAAWADYKAYMEDPGNPVASAFTLQPTYGTDPLRRRYIMQPGPPAISPVLTYFLLTFNIRTLNQSTGVSPLEVRARWLCTFWNPSTGALVPENLRLEVSGLPIVRIDDETASMRGVAEFPLESAFGSPLKISLPWDSAPTPGNSGEDCTSWLPGRTYTWASLPDSSGPSPINPGYNSKFYERNLSAVAGAGVRVPSPVSIGIDGNHVCRVDGDASTLKISVFAVRTDEQGNNADVLLGTFTSPPFEAFTSNSQAISENGYQFSYVFRLAESADNSGWLQSDRVDPHIGDLGSEAFVSGANGPSPALYENYTAISAPDRLLDRATNSYSYNEDVPIFEFPRSPLLSLGALQHLALTGARPFSVGNPWGSQVTLNEIPLAQIFDRFYFSGLVSGVEPIGTGSGLLLPNPLLRVIPRKSTGSEVSASDIRFDSTSRYLISGGAFNLNSVNAEAWAAVLRGVRFTGNQSFNYLDAAFETGTAGDVSTQPAATDAAQFFRFSQSAHEVFKSDKPVLGVTNAASTTPPTVGTDVLPNPPSRANTHLYRQGMKVLSPALLAALSQRIVQFINRKHKASASEGGPFRTIEEFLSPNALFADGNGTPRSLFEAAIADAATAGGESVNGFVAEFSSQFLTQGDIMTALAPVLFPRSDTFVIRTYGEAVNPATGATEGKAWCEATVQRIPEYFDPADDATVAPADLTSALNQNLGRRFKVVSFRWLTRSDI